MKNKTTQGLGNKTLLSFPKYDSNTEDKSNVNSHLTMQCNEIQHNTTQRNTTQQSESLSWSFSDLSGGKWCLQRK
jgi:hypothetical protein